MMSVDEISSVEVVTVSLQPPRTPPSKQPLPKPVVSLPVHPIVEDIDSATTLTPTASNYPSPRINDEGHTSSPSSPFYCHPSTRTSCDMTKTECKPFVDVYNVDLEKVERDRTARKERRCKSGLAPWPGTKVDDNPFPRSRRHIVSPMKGMSPRKKLLIKLFIALIIVSVAVAIGLGVSKAVGAGIWKSDGQTRPIGGDDMTKHTA